MNFYGKVTRSVLISISVLALALFAAFIYINNDLGADNFRKMFEKKVVSKLPTVQDKSQGSESQDGKLEKVDFDKSNVEVAESDNDLEKVFSTEEQVDNFDDLVE